jgi:hypothetical protein
MMTEEENWRDVLMRAVHPTIESLAQAATIKWAVENLNFNWPRVCSRQALFDLEMRSLGEECSAEEILEAERRFYDEWDDWAEDALFHAQAVKSGGLPLTLQSMEASYEALRRWGK